jgi:hypothetical protein
MSAREFIYGKALLMRVYFLHSSAFNHLDLALGLWGEKQIYSALSRALSDSLLSFLPF